MERVALESVEAEGTGSQVRGRGAGEAVGATFVALNHYRVGPGERISNLHAHGDQEEVFVVVRGTLTVEAWLPGTGDPDDATDSGRARELPLESGEAVRIAPGEYQSCVNRSDERAEVLAVGAPRETSAIRIPLRCADCGREGLTPTLVDDQEALVCPDCGHESIAVCASCGGSDLAVVLGRDPDDPDSRRPIERCRDCGAVQSGG